MLLVLALAALPALGNLAGGLLAEVVPLSERGLSLALHRPDPPPSGRPQAERVVALRSRRGQAAGPLARR